MEAIEIIIETPRGSNQKYNYDGSDKSFKLKKMLPLGMMFPFDFGFIPGTKGGDGDPIDVVLISEHGSFPGCKINCRVIGCIAATQSAANSSTKQVRNDRVIAIPEASLQFKKVQAPGDLPEKMIEQLTAFFVEYNRLEDKIFTPLGILDAEATMALIRD